MNQVAAMPVQAGAVTDNLKSGVFDWSKGAVKRKSASRTCNNVPAVNAESKPHPATKECHGSACSSLFMTEEQLEKKVLLFVNMTHACKIRIPELLAREAALLGSFDFTRLMNALEERGNDWSDEERYYVFRYADGKIGSVWLDGSEVYSLLCPRV